MIYPLHYPDDKFNTILLLRIRCFFVVLSETGPYRHGKIARYYLAATTQPQVELRISQELGRPEHDEYRWVSFEEGLELLGVRVSPVLEWAHIKQAA